MLAKVYIRKKTVLTVATLNTRSILSDESFVEMEQEQEKIIWNIVGVSEVRKLGEGLQSLTSGSLNQYPPKWHKPSLE